MPTDRTVGMLQTSCFVQSSTNQIKNGQGPKEKDEASADVGYD